MTLKIKEKKHYNIRLFQKLNFYLCYHSLWDRLALEILDLLLFQVCPVIERINFNHIRKDIVILTSGPNGPDEPGKPGAPGGPGQPYK